MALANQGFTLRHFPGRQAEALQSLRRYRQLTDRNASDHMTKLAVFTINEIEAEMTNEREGLPFDARVQHKMRGEACEVGQVASSWAGCDLCGGCGAAPTGRGKSHALCSGCARGHDLISTPVSEPAPPTLAFGFAPLSLAPSPPPPHQVPPDLLLLVRVPSHRVASGPQARVPRQADPAHPGAAPRRAARGARATTHRAPGGPRQPRA